VAEYDFKAGKERIDEILNSELEVIENEKIPSDNNLTFLNAYYSWVTAIFVDIRDSSTLFTKQNNKVVAKVIRSFTSEVIEILRQPEIIREIGIRGDCVYGIYTTPDKNDIYEVLDMAFYINTFMNMLNKLFELWKYPNIKVGIGLSSAKELVVKAGRKDTGINSKVWIGKAVTTASNLSSLANKNGYSSIILTPVTYDNTIDILVKRNGEKAKDWFLKSFSYEYGELYGCSIIKKEFLDWINEGMKK